LIISREQPVFRVYDLICRLGGSLPCEDRVLILGRDTELTREAEGFLRLDDRGLNMLSGLLKEAEAAGDPVGLLVLDSLSRLKPLDVEENDNDGMSQWLDKLEGIAVEHRTWNLLIHHQGHQSDGSRAEPRNAGRGASAIGAVAAGLLLLTRTRNPKRRLLKAEGNYVLGGEVVLEVAGDDDHPDKILYFRPVAALAEIDPAQFLEPGTPISTNELARRLSGKPRVEGEQPSGSYQRQAAKRRDRWEAEGLVEVFNGERGAKMLRLRDLPTSPRPHPTPEVKSREPHLTTAPIEARGGGEVERDSRPKEGDEGGRSSETGQPPQRVCSKTTDPGSTWRGKAHESGNRSA
jgi:hypothetical protein